MTTRKRGRIVRALAASTISAIGACGQYTSPNLCLDIDNTCSGRPRYGGGSAIHYNVVGFPLDRLDRSAILTSGGYRGSLHVGDTIALRLTMTVTTSVQSGIQVPATWALVDSSVAHLRSTADGGVLVVAVTPGKLLPLSANTTWYNEIYACDSIACTRLTQIDVVP